MRGKAWGGQVICFYCGITPAHAGKVGIEGIVIRHEGITPAHAGKSHNRKGGTGQTWDHPRACGEKKLDFASVAPYLGSPPRMRGKVDERTEAFQSGRITPAHAGKRMTDRAL